MKADFYILLQRKKGDDRWEPSPAEDIVNSNNFTDLKEVMWIKADEERLDREARFEFAIGEVRVNDPMVGMPSIKKS